jgi:uncharacterized membrane protein (DUF373 family)
MAEEHSGTRDRLGRSGQAVETALYVSLGILLIVGAVAALSGAIATLWTGLREGSLSREAFAVLEHLLLVLIFVELLHTVRISVHSHSLVLEPFLIVGLIASVRRILVITMQAARIIQNGNEQVGTALFRNSMIELALLGLLILVMSIAIFLLRRSPPGSPELRSRTEILTQ